MSELFFHKGNLWIYNCDFLQTTVLNPETIDLIITSPPYNIGKDYEVINDSMPYEEYLEFTKKWLGKCYTLLKPDGRLCVNIPFTVQKPEIRHLYLDIAAIARDVGYKYHTTIIWYKKWCGRRTAWGSYMSASAPCVIAPAEVILVYYREQWKKMRDGKSDITGREFREWTAGVWEFTNRQDLNVAHPAPFPIELPLRCIKLFSYVDDLILDPFLGSGTTLIACHLTNRAGIGIEINRAYCELAVKRLTEKYSLAQKLDMFSQKTS